MRYLEPETVDEALDLLAEHGDSAKVIAGGQSLLILMRERLVDVEALIGLRAIPALREIEVNGGARIRAMVTHSAVEGGEREVAAEDFFVGVMQTEAGPDELVTAVSLPAQPEGARTAYLKYAIRPLDFAIVSVAVRLVLDGDGAIGDARIALAGAASHTLRATEAERVLVGERPSPELLARAGQAAARQCEPLADVDGTPDYKRRVAGVYTTRALARALE